MEAIRRGAIYCAVLALEMKGVMNHAPMIFSFNIIQLYRRGIYTSRGFKPSEGPMRPSFSMVSMMRAARL